MDNGAGSYRRFLDGDERAFDELMQAYFRSLVFFLDRYVHDPYIAEDLAIDAFADLIVHPRRYNFQTSFKTYLFLVGKSRALDYLRRHKGVCFTELSQAQNLPDGEKELAEAVLADDRQRAVNGALAQLPPEMREAVHLIYFEEMTYEEAARVMGKKRKQVDNLLYRAKKELRCLLGEEGVQYL